MIDDARPSPTPDSTDRPERSGQRGWRALFDGRWRRKGGKAKRKASPAPPESPVTAFVLAGGGSRGAVQVGMLAELMARGIKADCIYGASVGAVNGAAFAGDPTPEGVAHLEHVWTNLTGQDVFPRGRMDGPWMYFQQRQSVHPNSGLRSIIEEGINFERLEDATLPLEVVATSLTDGRERWLTHGPAVDAVLASAAIPAIFPPVVIGDDTLIDGGVVNNVPLSRALAGGATRVYVLLCGPLHYRPRVPKRPVEAVLNAFFVAVHARFVRELANLPPGVEVVVFSGGGEPSSAYRDFSATHELIAQGREEVAATLDGERLTAPELEPFVVFTPSDQAADETADGTDGGDHDAAVAAAVARGRWLRKGRAPAADSGDAAGDADPAADLNGAPVDGQPPNDTQAAGEDDSADEDSSAVGAGERLASSRTAPQASDP